MYSEWGWLLILAVFIWLGGLTFFIWKQQFFLKSLFPKSGERDIRKKFEEVLKQTLSFGQDLDKLKEYLSEIDKLGVGHIQRVELFRYNPYDDTGGDQSFTLAMLDKKGNGIVLTSLHARSGTRVFAKPILLGRGAKHQLSDEEEKAIEGAMKRL